MVELIAPRTLRTSAGTVCKVVHCIVCSDPFENAQIFSTILAVDYGYFNELQNVGNSYYVLDPYKQIAVCFEPTKTKPKRTRKR